MSSRFQFALGEFGPSDGCGLLFAEADADYAYIFPTTGYQNLIEQVDSLDDFRQRPVQKFVPTVNYFCTFLFFIEFAVICQGFVHPWRGGEKAVIGRAERDGLEGRYPNAGDIFFACVNLGRRSKFCNIYTGWVLQQWSITVYAFSNFFGLGVCFPPATPKVQNRQL